MVLRTAIALPKWKRLFTRANKPKALSAFAKLRARAKTGSHERLQFCWQTKLHLARTKSGFLLTHTESAWSFLLQAETKRSLLTHNEAKLSIVSQIEPLQSK